MHSRSWLVALVTAGLVGVAAAAIAAQPPVEAPTEAEAAAIATDAYVYGYPLVTTEFTRRVMTNTAEPKGTHAPMGRFALMRAYPTAAFRDVTAPNTDTLYSAAWLDLSKEPYVLSLPDLEPIIDLS